MKRLAIVTSVFCAAHLSAATLHVPTAQHPNIQSAIRAAEDGDTVVVSPGIYYQNINFLGKAITVRSQNPDDPATVAATTIDGSAPSDPNTASVVTFSSGEDANSTLAGFTITGGTGSWLPVSWEFRGLRWNRCGGGVLCYNMSAPTITKNVFVGNLAGQGGAIYVYGDPVDPDDPCDPPVHIRPRIIDNVFKYNSALIDHGFDPPDQKYPNNDHGDGGAIVAFQGCDPVITGNLIEYNHAELYGGGLHLRQWSNGLVENNRVMGNDSALGAGVHVTYHSSPVIRNNLIHVNTAGNLGGGGIYVYYYSNPLIERNRLTENESAHGAAIAAFWDSEPVIRNNLVARNLAGAAMLFVGSVPLVAHNTVVANHGTGIYCGSDCSAVIENNIIALSQTGYGIYLQAAGQPVIRYNNLWANEAGNYGAALPDQTGLNGNISVRPAFIDADAGDYHLDYYSPCINAADPNEPGDGQIDIDGEPRRLGQFADIGADEAWPVWNLHSGARFTGIQQAIDDANDGTVIVLTRGTYAGTGNRDIDFRGKALTIRSADPNDHTVVAQTVIDCGGSETEPHRGFGFHRGEGADSVVQGLTITGSRGLEYGGALMCTDNSSPTISKCMLINNSVTDSGAAVFCTDHSDPMLSNCLLAGNTAGNHGGALFARRSDPLLVNCTVVGNRAAVAGAVASYDLAGPLLVNSILWANAAQQGPQVAVLSTLNGAGPPVPSEMTVSFSDLQGGIAATLVDPLCTLVWGPGNIDSDPCFARPGYWDDSNTPAEPGDDSFVVGDFHLLPGSPCIDAGDDGYVPAGSAFDMDREQRTFGGSVDMGLDEVVTNLADINGDGSVDFLDLALLSSEWLATGPLQTDLDSDGLTGPRDYAELARQWLWQGKWR